MATDQENMVDAFLDGASQSEANLEFTLTKDQLSKIKAAFKPLQFEEYIQFEFMSNGKIIVSSHDKGATIWTELSTTEMDLRGAEYQGFFIDLKRINKFADVCNGAIKFVVENGEMRAKIGTTDLHISLPMYDMTVDLSFTSEAEESKTSDDVAGLAARCQASKGSGAFMIPTMSLGKQWKYGTVQNVSIVNGGFSTLEALVPPDFLEYIANIPFTKEDVKFQVGKDEAGASVFVVSSDNVNYKCLTSELEFESIDELFAEEPECTFVMNTLDTISKLQVLSIPLVGQDNASFTMSIASEDTLEEGTNGVGITVRDEGHRESYDLWKCRDVKGEFEAPIGLQSYLNTVNAMSKENVTFESRGTALIIKDEVQTCILIKYM